ncbi:filamentous hemagglutinin N-terminal domain-containing protein [Limnobacter sp.]|uniref:two-partner secretion domain-containing protein n=1 Tax=Limnobacter sp. TaxID=2003368 RepID=UPI003514DFA4
MTSISRTLPKATSASFSLRPLAAFTMMMFASQSLALPTLDQTTPLNGVAVNLLNPSTLEIVQNNTSAVVNWTGFDIAAGEQVQVMQPNAQAVLVNKITSQNASEVLGQLQANGRIFLINPRGIVFGANAEINVGALVASTLDLKSGQVPGAEIALESLPDSGQITNLGTITAGEIALLAPQISNQGNLQANAGPIRLMSVGELTVNTSTEFLAFEVQAGHESAVIQQLGQLSNAGGEIFLIARKNVNGAPSAINIEGVQLAGRLSVEGDAIVLSAASLQAQQAELQANAINIRGAIASGDLSLRAATIEQDAAITVTGNTRLDGAAITLNHAGNDFAGVVVLENTGQVSLRDANGLIVQGTAAQVDLSAADSLQLQNLTAESVSAHADRISLDGLNTSGNVTLAANEVSQSSAISIGGETTLVGGNVRLDNPANEFAGQVTLQNAGQVSLRDSNNLTVQGSAAQVDLSAADSLQLQNLTAESLSATGDNIVLDGVNTSGNATLAANEVSQFSAISIGGETTLVAGNVSLNNSANDFAGQVTLQNAGQVSLRDSNNLTVQGSTAQVDLSAVDSLQLQNLTAESLSATGDNIVLDGVSTSGNATLAANEVSQFSAISIGGETTLVAGNVSLNNSANDFAGQVTLQNAGQVNLRDSNNLHVQGTATRLDVNAADSLQLQNLTAESVVATAGEILLDGLNTSGNVTLAANEVSQSSAISIGGQTTLVGGNINLTNSANDFVGQVALQNAGRVNLRDSNNLHVQGAATRLDVHVANSLQLQNLTAETVSAHANSILLDAVNTSRNVTLAANEVSQSSAVSIGGQTTLVGGNVSLNNSANDFASQVTLQNAGQVSLRDSNNLTVQGSAAQVDLSATDSLQLQNLTAESLSATGDNIVLDGVSTSGNATLAANEVSQFSAISIGGQTTLVGGNISLDDSANEFVGQVTLQNAGQVNLRDSNNLTIQGSATRLDVHVADSLQLQNLTAESVAATAGEILLDGLNTSGDVAFAANEVSQSSAISVGGQTTLVGGNISLDNPANEFAGQVKLQNAGQVNLRDSSNLTVQGSAAQVDLSAADSLHLQNLTAESLSATGDNIELDGVNTSGNVTLAANEVSQSSAISIGGQTTLVGGNVSLNNSANDFAGQVTLQNAGQVNLRDSNQLLVQGSAAQVDLSAADSLHLQNLTAESVVATAGEILLDGLNTSGDVALAANEVNQSSAISIGGQTTLVGGNINLIDSANEFVGQVALQNAGQVSLRDSNELLVTGSAAQVDLSAADSLHLQNLTAESVSARADGILLDAVNTSGSATLTANEVSQVSAIAVGGETTLVGGNVSLDNSANEFAGRVTLQNAGQVNLRDSNNLTIQGGATRLNVHAADSLQLQNLTAELVSAHADGILLDTVNTSGNATLTANEVIQSSAISIGGQTTLVGGNINLTDSANEFAGRVTLKNAGQVNLRDSNDLLVQGSAVHVDITAIDSLQLQNLTAESVSAHADRISLDGLNTSGNATLTANKVSQVSAIAVGGETTLVGGNINLIDSANEFVGQVTLQNAGQVNLRDLNDLLVQGSAAQVDLSAADSLHLQNLTAESVSAHADRISLDGLNTSGNATLAANEVSQSSAISIGGQTTLVGGNINLTDSANEFVGQVTLQNAGQVAVASQAPLVLTGQSQSMQVDVHGGFSMRGVQTDSLKADAHFVDVARVRVNGDAAINAPILTQTGTLQVLGDLALKGDSVILSHADNQFSSEVVLNGVERVQLRGVDTLNVLGRAAIADLHAAGQLDVSLTGLTELSAQAKQVRLHQANTTGNLKIQAQQVNQSQALTVGGQTQFQGGVIALDHAGNDFRGEVVFNRVDHASLHDANQLSVAGQVRGTLQLHAIHIEQNDALTIEGSLLAQANSVQLNHANNHLPVIDLGRAEVANVRSEGSMQVQAAGQLEQLDAQADLVRLGQLGRVEGLRVQAGLVEQTEAVNTNQAHLFAPQVSLTHTGNRIDGTLVLGAAPGQEVNAHVNSAGHLSIQAGQLAYKGQVGGHLQVNADALRLGALQVEGLANLTVQGGLSQSDALAWAGSNIVASSVALDHQGNRLNGLNTLNVRQGGRLASAEHLTLDVGQAQGAIGVNAAANLNLRGDGVVLGQSDVLGDLQVEANSLAQVGALQVQGEFTLNVVGGNIQLEHAQNRFNGSVAAHADRIRILNSSDLRLRSLFAREGHVETSGRLLLDGDIQLGAGQMSFVAHHRSAPLSSAALSRLLPASLDVFSGREPVDPLTGLGRIHVASAAIEQRQGRINAEAGGQAHFSTPNNASVMLLQDNQIRGGLSVLAGLHGADYAYQASQGASLVAVNNAVALNTAGVGVEGDLIAIRSRGLSTPQASVLRARMPYNDFAAGASRSFPALTLSVPVNNAVQPSVSSVVPFGEPGAAPGPNPRAIQVSVGAINSAGLGGYMTVLPFEGASLVPGQVIHLSGPGQSGAYNFFYDGAGVLTRIPVSYNGAVLLSPQESAALTSAQGAVVLARQEQTRSVVRTENVAGKVIQGVVVEVGPGRPATVGDGELAKPAACDNADQGLSCAP